MFWMEQMTDKIDNILQFPQLKIPGSPQSPQELAEQLSEYKKEYADEIAEILWNNILGELTRAGCYFDENIEEYYPSMILLLESIRSLHLHSNGIDHPLQKYAKEAIAVPKIKKLVDKDEDLD